MLLAHLLGLLLAVSASSFMVQSLSTSVTTTPNSSAPAALSIYRQRVREIVTTTACTNIRRADSYPIRLDLIYIYFMDYYHPNNLKDGTTLDLEWVEKTIATSVAATLNECDAELQPAYAVELSEVSVHRIMSTGKCLLFLLNEVTLNQQCLSYLKRLFSSIYLANK